MLIQGERSWTVALEEPGRWLEALEQEAALRARAPMLELMPPQEYLMVFLEYPREVGRDLERVVQLDLEVRSPWEGASWLIAPPLEFGPQLRVPVFLVRPEALRRRARLSLYSVPLVLVLLDLLEPAPCLLVLDGQVFLWPP